jgi:hypothetical protein
MRTRNTIALDSARCKGATPDQAERLMQCVVWCAEVADELRIHHDALISICYDADKVLTIDKVRRYKSRVNYSTDGQWIARVDMDRAEYGKYRIWFSPFGLTARRDECRLLDVAHEMFHIMVYSYTGIAESLAADWTDLLQKREETLVTALEHMYGGIFELREV